MFQKFSKKDKDFIIVHLIFITVCILILSLPIPLPIGIKLFILVIVYNLLVALVGLIRKDKAWIKLWFFTLMISVFQIFPDWFLSAELNILIFPEDGLFKIGTVSGYMLGLWAIPLFMICFIGLKVEELSSKRKGFITVTVCSLLIFGIAEQSMWLLNSWYPQSVTLIFDHLAIYIILPEILLGLSTFYFYSREKSKKMWILIIYAFIIMILYLGNASFFFFLIEKIIL